MLRPEYESFSEYYEHYKEIIDKCIPEAVLNRLLGRTQSGEQMGDAWEPESGKYYDENGEELPF
ncbi:hypothetical protein CLHUN_01720 [Ruminiclostridium hungatei]|uniref:Uncharacterized protein n=1 Tax=Ruminiclostridium hungatei TaxID=48256 RepID=A0A1V4SSB2_RUMHU|nr:hypothetical protein [Ruminiclostridium hungatei]OPX46356.1 hypothetical protein CLHUN_01720 [Ruminiclostridium hungatei]